jgi:hypothetical protein
MVLPYLKGSSLYSCVIYGENVLISLKCKGFSLLYLSSFTISGIIALSWARSGRFFFL